VDELTDAVDRWLADGLITAAQAEAMKRSSVMSRNEPLSVDVPIATPVDANEEAGDANAQLTANDQTGELVASGQPGANAQPGAVDASGPGAGASLLVKASPLLFLVEGLGYLGSAIVAAAIAVITAGSWDQLNSPSRVALPAIVTLVTLVGGVGVRLPGDSRGRVAALERLASVLWAISTVMFAITAGVICVDVLDFSGDGASFAVFAPTLAYATVLWWRGRGALLQLVAFGAAIAATEGSLFAFADHVDFTWVGIAFWATGLAWCLFAWAGALRPVSFAWLAGGATMLLAAEALNEHSHWLPIVVGVATVAGFVSAGMVLRRAEPVVVGGCGLLLYVPQFTLVYLGKSVGIALAMLLAGFAVLAGAVALVRLRSRW
jgi:hypothetical protein